MGKQRLWRVLLAAFLLLLLAASATQAANIIVDAGGTCTLADAITAANTDTATGGCAAGSGDDTITLQTDVTLSAALPTITSTVIIKGGYHFISGNNDANVGTVLRVTNSGNLTLNQVIVTRGYNSTTGCGGGIYNNGGTLTLSRSAVSRNSVFSSSSSSRGGGICSYSGTITLTDSTVSGNSVDSSSFSYNSYSEGGGIYSGGTITLTNSTVSGNSVDSSSSYTSSSRGGGICSYSGTVTLTNSTVSGNSATSYYSKTSYSEGGGILSYNGTIRLTSSTVSRNSAASFYSYFSSDGGGGGIRNHADGIILRSSIISGNTASSGNEIMGAVTAACYNLFGHDGESSSQAFSGFTPGSSDVTATSDGTKPTALAAILSPLANNGGPTQTHALPEGSPAIDLDTTCSAGLTTDQRGYIRPVGAGCDAGSFEYGGVPTVTGLNMAPIYKLLLLKKR